LLKPSILKRSRDVLYWESLQTIVS